MLQTAEVVGANRRFDHAELARFYVEEGSLVRAARRAGCSTQTVHVAARRAGVMRNRRGEPRANGRPLGVPYRKVSSQGYVYWVFRSWRDGKRRYDYLLEHRILMEEYLGRPLLSWEEVHHKNGVRHDNRIGNFELRVKAHGAGMTHCPHCGEALG